MKRGFREVHVRKVRPAKRRRLDVSIGKKVQQVRALCGKWVPPCATLREDEPGHVLELADCPDCFNGGAS